MTWLDQCADRLKQETDSFVLRVALWVIWQGHRELLEQPDGAGVVLAQRWLLAFSPCLAALHQNAADLAVRRWAAQTRERLWLQADAERLALYQRLASRLSGTRPGRGRRIPRALLADTDTETLGRVLSLIFDKPPLRKLLVFGGIEAALAVWLLAANLD